jgi:regulatory protein YycI of two-component signal transduction system YycFG
MKITLKGPFRKNTRNIFRDLGYSFYKQDIDTQELIFFRPARGYPRFHIYLKEANGELIVNLHLDQKRPVYSQAHAHQAEYDGKLIEQEAERIKDSTV